MGKNTKKVISFLIFGIIIFLLLIKNKEDNDNTNSPVTPTNTEINDYSDPPITEENFDQLDQLFQAYSACTCMDWRVTKQIIFQDNEFLLNKERGLFQESQDSCRRGIKIFFKDEPNNLSLSCTLSQDRMDPDTNAAVTVAQLDDYLTTILKTCPNINTGNAISLISVAHNSGIGVMSKILKKSCEYNIKGRKITMDYWKHHGRQHEEAFYKMLYSEKIVYGKYVQNIDLQSPAVITLRNTPNPDICPRDTGQKVFGN